MSWQYLKVATNGHPDTVRERFVHIVTDIVEREMVVECHEGEDLDNKLTHLYKPKAFLLLDNGHIAACFPDAFSFSVMPIMSDECGFLVQYTVEEEGCMRMVDENGVRRKLSDAVKAYNRECAGRTQIREYYVASGLRK